VLAFHGGAAAAGRRRLSLPFNLPVAGPGSIDIDIDRDRMKRFILIIMHLPAYAFRRSAGVVSGGNRMCHVVGGETRALWMCRRRKAKHCLCSQVFGRIADLHHRSEGILLIERQPCS